MKYSKIVLATLFLTLGFSAVAQQREVYNARSVAHSAGDTSIIKTVGWVRYHFLDEWNVSIQDGGQLYYGTEDRLGNFKDRFTNQTELYIGRMVFPMVGFRFGAGLGSASGFLSIDTYNAHQETILSEDHNGTGGISGNDASGNSLGGYYYNYNNELYQQQWKYHYFMGDVLFDLRIFRDYHKYNPGRKWQNFIYAGVATRFAHSELDGCKNHKSELHCGYMLKYNFNQHWSAYADIRASFIERTFDREWVGGVEPVHGFGDFVLNAQMGVNYHFNMRDDETRKRFYALQNPDIDDLIRTSPGYTHYVKMNEYQEMHIVDSIFSYANDSVPTPQTQYVIDSLKGQLDQMIDNGKRDVWKQPLDSILLNRLLPYEMVFFELDKWDILPSEELKIAKMAYIMKTYPDEKFVLIGSADSKTGTVKRNDFLSHSRADIVYNKLIAEFDINPEQLEREYLGGILDYDPFVLNRTTVIIMDHPVVRKAFNDMKANRKAGSGTVEINN